MSLKAPFGIPKDKWLHVIVGFMISIWLIPDFALGLGFWGWVLCLFVAYVMKEVVYDMILKKGNYELLDAAYTMVFPTIILLIHLIFKL